MGKILLFFIQLGLRVFGKRVDLQKESWLAGPHGKTDIIGEAFYHQLAKDGGYDISINIPGEGLMPEFKVFDGRDFSTDKVQTGVKDFYSHTSDFALDVWNEWHTIIRYFAAILIKTISPHMQQMNIPLHSLDTSYGMGSDIIQFRKNDQHQFTCWFRTSLKTGKVIYAGFYSTVKLPSTGQTCVRVVFPLPKGSVTVILQPQQQADGSFKLISAGHKFGGPGYYRMHYINEHTAKVRMIPIQEVIHVFTDHTGTLRTNHDFSFCNLNFLRLHYKINRRMERTADRALQTTAKAA